MSDKSKIEWTDASWSPVVGCTKVSAGCDNCYAERMAVRQGYMEEKRDFGRLVNDKTPVFQKYRAVANKKGWNGEIYCDESALEIPLHWRNPRRIFVVSMGDLFHPNVDIGFLTHIFDTIKQCPQHTFQILTKRPKQALKMMWGKHGKGWRYFGDGDYHPNVHFGITAENQEMADKRIPILLQIPASVRFVSIEPMLGQVDLRFRSRKCGNCGFNGDACFECETAYYKNRPLGIHWVIVGGESGPNARPIHPCWARSIRDQCVAAGVPFFFKQWGAGIEAKPGKIGYKDVAIYPDGIYVRVTKKKAGRLLDGREWNEYPKGGD